MAKSTGAETPAAEPAATTPVETPAAPVEPAQDNDVVKKYEEIQGQLATAQAAIEKITKEKNDAIANQLRLDAMYKGLQNQTTKTLQKAAEDRKALVQAQIQAAEVSDIKSLLNTLASKVLDEDEAKQLQWSQKELDLKRREQALQAIAAAPEETVETPQQYVSPEDEKSRFLSFYFPGVEIDPSDPNIDWGVGANSQPEALQRFNASVIKIMKQQDQIKTNDAVSVLQAQANEQLAELKKQQEELAAKTTQEIADAKTAAVNEARKEAENRLRALGADVSGGAPSDGGRKTLRQNIDEQLDDNQLRTKKGAEQYNRNLEAMKQQFREQFQK